MHLIEAEQDSVGIGDFDALLIQLEKPPLLDGSCYATLMARIASPEFRRTCGAAAR